MAAARTADAPGPSRYAWAVVGLLFVVALLNYLDRLMIASMREPITAQIPMSDARFGLLTSAFLWVYAAASPLGGFLADRVGRRAVITASLFFWSAATSLSGFATTFEGLMGARALMGLSEACYVPAALALIADYHPGRTRSLATGLHMTGIYAGAALGGAGGYVAQCVGWRAGFRAFGAAGVVYSVVLLLFLRDARPPVGVGPDTGSDPGLEPGSVAPGGGFGATLAALLGRGGFRVLLVLNVLVGVANWVVYGWLPTYLKEHFRLGLGAAGLSATAYIQAASFAGVLAAGAAADRWSRATPRARALVPAAGFCLAGPFLAAAGATDVFGVAVASLVVFGLGRGAFDANQMPLLRELVAPRHSATGYGLLNFVSTAAGGAMVYAGGALRDARVNLGWVFQACGAALFVGGLLLLFVRAPRRGVGADGRTRRPLAAAEV